MIVAIVLYDAAPVMACSTITATHCYHCHPLSTLPPTAITATLCHHCHPLPSLPPSAITATLVHRRLQSRSPLLSLTQLLPQLTSPSPSPSLPMTPPMLPPTMIPQLPPLPSPTGRLLPASAQFSLLTSLSILLQRHSSFISGPKTETLAQ